MAPVLRYGIRNNFAVISFLIVSTAEFCEKISQGLLNIASHKKYRILVHRCETINNVVDTYKNLHVDFIVFAIDSRRSHSLAEVEANIFLIDRSFVLYGQTCLVNGNKINANTMGVTIENILETCNKYHLRLLNANIAIPEECLYLGDNILNLALAVLGQKSGFPLMSAPNQYPKMSSANDSE